jgi:hypothetical protein
MYTENKPQVMGGYFTAAEVATALAHMAPCLDRAWRLALDNDAVWQARAREKGWLRTWWLRWQLRRAR